MNEKIKYNWKKAILTHNATIGEVIKNLSATSLQIVLIVSNEGKLEGTITDGDIRRGMINGYGLEDKIMQIMKKDPFVVTKQLNKKTARYLMKVNSLLQVPIVDNDRKVVGLHLWNEEFHTKVKDNYIVIMAGGFGKRMKPQTNDCPKPMLNVGGRPMLEIILEQCIEAGFKKFYISFGYRRLQ